jgi:hypothetical protein
VRSAAWLHNHVGVGLDEDTLARYNRILGRDHPYILHSASTLAADLHPLDNHQAAPELEEDALRRRVLGEDQPDTFASATCLAADMRAFGQAEAARDLDEDILERYHRIHPNASAWARSPNSSSPRRRGS